MTAPSTLQGSYTVFCSFYLQGAPPHAMSEFTSGSLAMQAAIAAGGATWGWHWGVQAVFEAAGTSLSNIAAGGGGLWE